MSDLALESVTVEDPWKFLEEELLKFQTVVKELEELGESLQELELAQFLDFELCRVSCFRLGLVSGTKKIKLLSIELTKFFKVYSSFVCPKFF